MSWTNRCDSCQRSPRSHADRRVEVIAALHGPHVALRFPDLEDHAADTGAPLGQLVDVLRGLLAQR